jgi:metallo-beta-lactamase class B
MRKYLSFFSLVAFILCCGSAQAQSNKIIVSDSLRIIPLSANVFMHVSDLLSPQFGKVPCNGLIYVNGKEAVIMDTPASIGLSVQLLDWFKTTFPDVKLKALIVNHFHADCLGGIKVFHEAGAISYSHKLTPDLLKLKNEPYPAPQITFDETLTLDVGGKKVVLRYLGEAHTRDNIVAWIEDEKILFGGCMVKEVNATKGYLGDANIKEWPATIARVKKEFSKLKFVIPGHGDHGGVELLDYTIKLFSPK